MKFFKSLLVLSLIVSVYSEYTRTFKPRILYQGSAGIRSLIKNSQGEILSPRSTGT